MQRAEQIQRRKSNMPESKYKKEKILKRFRERASKKGIIGSSTIKTNKSTTPILNKIKKL